MRPAPHRLALLALTTLLGCACDSDSPAGQRTEQRPFAGRPELPRWGNMALEGCAILVRGEGAKVRIAVLASDRLEALQIPDAVAAGREVAELNERRADKLVLGALYEALLKAGAFDLPAPPAEAPGGAWVELWVSDGTRRWRSRGPAEGAAPTLAEAIAAFEKAWGEAQASGG